METWKPIYDLYEVSNDGRIRRTADHVELSTRKPDFLGYCHVTLKVNGRCTTKYVHRIVAYAFVDNPFGKKEVHHKNGDKTDNRASNLEWVNHAEHAAKDKARRNGKPTKHRENYLARKEMMSF